MPDSAPLRSGDVHVVIRVELKPEVEDAEAENVARALELLGVPGLRDVRLARLYDLEFSGLDRASAERAARDAVDRLLANPVIHRVTIVVPPA